MNQLGTDFDTTGSVMTPQQLHEYRLKKGECVTCGRKCFNKKFFKMIPITDHGNVLKGRCLHCNPLDSGDASKQADGGVIPAVSRRATREDLVRFSKSQSNLALGGGGGGPMGPGPGLQRNAASSRVLRPGAPAPPLTPSSSSSSTNGSTPRRATAPRILSASTSSDHSSDSMQAMQTHARGLSTRSNLSSGSGDNNNNLGSNSTGSGRAGNAGSTVPRRLSFQPGQTSAPMHGNSSIRSTSRDSLMSNDESVASHQRPNVGAGGVIEEEPSTHDISDHPDYDAHADSPESPDHMMLSRSAHMIMNRKDSDHVYGSPGVSDHDGASFGDDREHDFHDDGVNVNGNELDFRSHHSHRSYRSGEGSRNSRSHRRDMGEEEGGDESFNASENYDDYAPLPDFHAAAGAVRPSGEEIQDALERITGQQQEDGGGNGEHHPQSPNNSSNRLEHNIVSPAGTEGTSDPYYFDRLQSERSLGSAHSGNNATGHTTRRDASSRSLQSNRSRNTEDDYDRNMPKHGILNRGGAVNLVHMANGQPQNQNPPSALGAYSDHDPSYHDGRDPIPYDSGHRHVVVTPGRDDYRAMSTRSFESVSSFEDENHNLPHSLVERQDSTSAFPPNLRSQRSSGGGSVGGGKGMSTYERLNSSNPSTASSGYGGGRDQPLNSSSNHSYNLNAGRSQHTVGGPSMHSDRGHGSGTGMDISGHSLTIAGAVVGRGSGKGGEFHNSGSGETFLNSSYISTGTGHGSQASADGTEEGFRRLSVAGTDFVQIIRIMRDYPKSEPLQTNCMQEISNLHLSPEDCDALTNLGGIQAMMQAMRRFPEEAELQLCACRALCNISGTQENQLALVDVGAADLLLDTTMERFGDIPELQEQAMAALANLAALESNLERLIEKEIVSRVVQAMNKHGSDIHVQMKGCSVITNLASHPGPMKSSVMMAGGGGAVVLSMVLHSKDAPLQEKGLQALRNLSANCEENKVELAHIGGIDASITAMQVHRDDPYVQEAGAWTLCNLAGNMNNKKQIGESGGIDVVVRAMWVHSDQVSVHEWCTRSLFSLSLHPTNGRMIMDVGGISAVVNSMQAHEKSPVLQEMGCAILCNLASNEQAKLRIVDEEALDAIVLAMVLFGDDAKVQERACQVLLQLAIAQNVTAMHASNVVELVRVAAGRFPEICGGPAEQLIAMIDEFSSGYSGAQGGIPVGGGGG